MDLFIFASLRNTSVSTAKGCANKEETKKKKEMVMRWMQQYWKVKTKIAIKGANVSSKKVLPPKR